MISPLPENVCFSSSDISNVVFKRTYRSVKNICRASMQEFINQAYRDASDATTFFPNLCTLTDWCRFKPCAFCKLSLIGALLARFKRIKAVQKKAFMRILYLTQVIDFLTHWKLNTNKHKAETIMLCRKNTQPPLTVQNQSINWSRIKYLGTVPGYKITRRLTI